MHRLLGALALFTLMASPLLADPIRQTKGSFEDKFRQLEDEDWPTPNGVRSATGAPGPQYWQQEADYRIQITLDEAKRRLSGSSEITYTNNSPETLTFLWVQLDQNRFRADSLGELSATARSSEKISYRGARRMLAMQTFKGGYDISGVTGKNGEKLPYVIVDTMMRIDLPTPLAAGEKTTFKIGYAYNIVEAKVLGGRGGYECFTKKDEDGNCIFEISQWYPRISVFSDYEGWHNKAFLGRGEFTLEFGSYDVEITVPADLVVASTGDLLNPEEVLSETQRERLEKAKTAKEPVFIVTPKEAAAAEKGKAKVTKTWKFHADDVRDFAWSASRKFIWDSMGVALNMEGSPDTIMAMSFYPKEAEPLWSTYSTKAVAHTLDVYSRFSTPYPWPKAISVNGPVGGMEYPMITFNGPRPTKDDDGNLTYSRRTKYGLISVIIHEIGHGFFPMTVNSDERQWTWMDEGLNTFTQYLAEREWEENYPSRRGEPKDIANYMKSQYQVPIMTNSESILQFGNNAYGKPATALAILRETILGRELFDKAFSTYANRWRFKRPTPYDFFRTMEEVSGVDLDWFWRGWFYSTDHVDISIDKVVKGTINTQDPDVESKYLIERDKTEPASLAIERNADIEKWADRDPSVIDFYNKNGKHAVSNGQRKKYKKSQKKMEQWKKDILSSKENFYFMTFTNKGGLVMPILLELEYADGSKQSVRLPAEVWKNNPKTVTTQVMSPKELVSVRLDPNWETADVDVENNYYPRRIIPSRLEVYKGRKTKKNLMQKMDMAVERDSMTPHKAKKSKKGKKDE
jgi:Peptidase family M1 domain